jgi:hypothetical protein
MAGAECPEENGDEEEEDSMGIFVISRFGPRWREWAACHVRKNGHVGVPHQRKGYI